jgi:hypothetical protein
MNQNEHSTIDPRDIQRYLADHGFDPGPIDGVIGKRTMEQVRRFLASRSYIIPSDKHRLVAVEQLLMADNNCYFGKIDGLVGPKTLAAYETWETSAGPAIEFDREIVGGINRTYFFDRIRHSLFGGKLTNSQADAITRYLDYRDSAWPAMPDAELAYLLATVKHETAHEMVPVKERGGEVYLRSKPYYPWYGRGPIQLTWEDNYKKFGITNPDDALEWPAALDIAFRGMIRGMFTGKKLADYIRSGVGTSARDYVAARRIINGTDKARLIAGYADAFFDALAQSRQQPVAPLAA